jgi:DNA-binding CsgD family transcriptional regulator
LAAIAAALERARGGSRGATLLIEGPAGVGKTALLGELERRGAAEGFRVLRARGSEMERDFGFGLIRQLFGPLLRSLSPEQRARLFSGPAALAGAIFGLTGDGGLETGGTESSLYGLFWMTATLAEDGPLILVVDDAHWGDTASLRFVRYLDQRLDGLPVLVAVAARPHEPGVHAEALAGLGADPEVATTRPALLSPAGTAALVQTRLGGVGGEVEAALHRATGGNPFLIEELVSELEADTDRSAVSPRQIADMGPERIAAGVLDRAGRVGGGPEVVRAIAVLGEGANLRAVAGLAGTELEVTAAIVDALAAASILVHESGHGFLHPLLASAVYEDIPAATRATLHARAADLLGGHGGEPEEVAAHLLRCEPGVVAGALETLDAAAASASVRGAPDSAATYLTRALAEQPEPARRAELLHRLGSAEVLLREPASVAHLQEAAELAPDPRQALESWLALIEMLFIAGQWDAAVATAKAALARFEGAELPGLLELEALYASGLGYHPDLVAEYEDHLPGWLAAVLGRRNDESSRLRWVLATLGAIRDQPRDQVIELLGPISADWVLGVGDRESTLTHHGVVAALMIEALEEGERVVAALLDYGRASGSVMAIVAGMGLSASFEQRRGNLPASEASLRIGLELLRENEFSAMALATTLNFCTDTILERRALQDVAETVEALEVPPTLAPTFWGAMALEVRGAIRLRRGERAAAIAELRDAERIFRLLRVGPRFSGWRSRLALALPEEDRDEALALAAEELELARAGDSPRAIGVAQRAIGALRGGEEGVEVLRESVASLRESPSRLELARSLAELGAALRRGNQRGEAREHLREAADLAQRCGAERLEERIDEELRVAGARPRRRALSGAESLTPGEQRVAAAAAGGSTNREIAQDLFVSLRTVEMHLTNAYRKLDISSRSELVEAIDETSRSDAGL